MIDWISSFSDGMLRNIYHVLKFIASLGKPLTAAYQFVNSYTLGCARYIVLVFVLWLLYFVLIFVWWVLKGGFRLAMWLFALVTGGTYSSPSMAPVTLGDAASTIAAAVGGGGSSSSSAAAAALAAATRGGGSAGKDSVASAAASAAAAIFGKAVGGGAFKQPTSTADIGEEF